ncbi:MAG: hypothetical protein HYY24_00305 [Verrucomicrobia bacterium]|nr:hypothetical protein [Verrucomicrobiota bacterium]
MAAHLKDKSPLAKALYREFAAAVRACGPTLIAPTQTRIGFKAPTTFAVVALKKEWLEVEIVLPRRLAHPRFTKAVSLSARNHVHVFRVRSAADIDEEVRGWLAEAYRAGRKEDSASDEPAAAASSRIGQQINEVMRKT